MSFSVQAHHDTLASSRTLVIGGTSGIGAAVVSAALASGSSVFISSSNPEKVTARIAEFKALYPGGSIAGTAANLADENVLEENIKRILEEAVAALGGPIDHIVYTAGDELKRMKLSDLDAKTYFSSWNVRLLGPMVIAKLISGNPGIYIKADANSSISLTSGVLAHKPIPGVSHFTGWAGAIETITKGLAIDLAPVRVNTIAPGAIHTEMLASMGEAAVQSFGQSTLRKKVGTPAEAAEAYLFSMRSAFLTGEIVKVDGGALFA